VEKQGVEKFTPYQNTLLNIKRRKDVHVVEYFTIIVLTGNETRSVHVNVTVYLTLIKKDQMYGVKTILLVQLKKIIKIDMGSD